MRYTFTQEQQSMMDEVIADCDSKMRSIGLVPGKHGMHVLPISNGRYLGLCKRKGHDTGAFEIECCPSLDRRAATEVLFHELAHTLPGCYNHGKGFLAACKCIDEAFGSTCEPERIHYHCNAYFKQTYHLLLRFTGGLGEQYGILSRAGELLLPLYQIVSLLPDGKREVVELSSGQTFAADLVEMRGLRYHAARQLKRYPNMEETLRKVTANSRRQYFTNSSQDIMCIGAEPKSVTVAVGSGGESSLCFETTGLGREGFHVVRNMATGETLSADVFEVSRLSYRRRYLSYEAIMRSGIGGLPDTWIRCSDKGHKDAITSLASLVESIWNINELMRGGASSSRTKGPLDTLDTRILAAAEKCGRSLEDTLLYGLQAFTGYAIHRGIAMDADAMSLVAERV